MNVVRDGDDYTQQLVTQWRLRELLQHERDNATLRVDRDTARQQLAALRMAVETRINQHVSPGQKEPLLADLRALLAAQPQETPNMTDEDQKAEARSRPATQDGAGDLATASLVDPASARRHADRDCAMCLQGDCDCPCQTCAMSRDFRRKFGRQPSVPEEAIPEFVKTTKGGLER